MTGSVVKSGEYATDEERESVVPERYSKDSTLVREVKSGKNEFNFQLSSEQ